jgi:hypothetical protein
LPVPEQVAPTPSTKLLRTGSSKPFDQTFYELPALAEGRIVVFVDGDREPGPVVATYLLEPEVSRLGFNPTRCSETTAKPSLKQFQAPQGRSIVVPARPGVLIPEILTANLMRHERRARRSATTPRNG